MIHVLARASGEVRVFAGVVWIKPTRTCPAACCDIQCTACAPSVPCPHSGHGGEGYCIVRRDGEDFRCEAFVPSSAGVEFSDCACESAETCEHGAALRERAGVTPSNDDKGHRAGLQRERFLDRDAHRATAAESEGRV